MTVRKTIWPPNKKSKTSDTNSILEELRETNFINEFNNLSPIVILPQTL